MKKITFLTFVCLAFCLTACGNKTEIPPVDLIEIPTPTLTTTVSTETIAPPPETTELLLPETQTSETTLETLEMGLPTETETTLTETILETESTEPEEETPTETTTEAKPKNTAWVKAYRKILSQHLRDKEENETAETDTTDETNFDDDNSSKKDDETEPLDNQWFVLIYLDDDKIPELVILDETDMELYCFDGKTTQLLLEDSYKSDALDGQNVCYQPYSGYIASAFTTMSGGDGFTIYHFDQLDAVHVQRYYFNNNENVEGEMAYNEIWDRAEEFEVIDNGYHDVSLGDSWTHITSEMDGAFRLTLENANTLTADLSPDIDKNAKQDPTEKTEEDE